MKVRSGKGRKVCVQVYSTVTYPGENQEYLQKREVSDLRRDIGGNRVEKDAVREDFKRSPKTSKDIQNCCFAYNTYFHQIVRDLD